MLADLAIRTGVRASPLFRYGFAIGAVLVSALAREGLTGSLPDGFPFVTFFPAVIVTAFIAGAGPGALCAALCGLLTWYRYVAPFNSWELGEGGVLAMGLYVFVVVVDIVVIEAMRRTAVRLQAEKEFSAELANRQSTLFAELQHRVANNLAFVGSLLQLNRRRVEREPAAAAEVFDESIRRIELMGRIHRRLYKSDTTDQDTGDYLRALCADLLDATGASNIVCLVRADPARLDISRLTPLSLLVLELMTNSLKHAFAGRDRGTITVDLKRVGDRYELTVGDDGPGMPDAAPIAAPARANLGLTIIRGLAQQLGAELRLPGPRESATRLAFAA